MKKQIRLLERNMMTDSDKENEGMQVSDLSIENVYNGVTIEVPRRPIMKGICRSVNSSVIFHTKDYCDGRMSLALMIAMLVLGFFTVLVNLGVIIRTVKILRHGHDNKPSFYFIGNLALSDLAIGLFVIIAFLLHITHQSDLWQQTNCMLQIGVAVTACQETVFTIMLIAVDKYLYICHGLKYTFLVTTSRVYTALALSWVLSILIGSLPALGMHVTWEEACNRCVFAQVVSTKFTIVFFVTSVAGPYAVVVSLYSVLLVLALKMHKARYGGSYTGDEKARSSNFRLSIMSKKSKSSKSSKSSRSTSTSSIPKVSDIKANRRRTRKKEKAEYKATLPGISERDAADQLISYQSRDPEQRRESQEGEVTGKLIQGHVFGEDQVRQDVGVPEESLQASPPRKFTFQSDNDAVTMDTKLPSEEKHASRVEKADDHIRDAEVRKIKITEAEGVELPTNEDINCASINSDGHCVDNQENCVVKGVTDNYIRQHTDLNSFAKDDSSEGHEVPLTPIINDTEDPNSTEEVKPRQKSTCDTDEEFPPPSADEDTSEGHSPPSPQSGASWLLTNYFNRVVSDTRDKVLFLKKCRAIKTVFLIIGSFTATYVPFVVGTMVYSLETEKKLCLLHMLNTLLYCAVVANSLANPLIYAYGYREFRMKSKRFKGIFARKRLTKFARS